MLMSILAACLEFFLEISRACVQHLSNWSTSFLLHDAEEMGSDRVRFFRHRENSPVNTIPPVLSKHCNASIYPQYDGDDPPAHRKGQFAWWSHQRHLCRKRLLLT